MEFFTLFPPDDGATRSVVVGPFPSREAATQSMPNRNGHVVGELGDVLWTGRTLVDVFNSVTGGRVSKFESYDIGRTRLFNSLAAHAITPTAERTDEVPRLTDEQKAEREQARATKQVEREQARATKQVEREAAKAAKTSGRAPVRKISGAGTITVLAEKNPKREGTKAHGAFSLYRDGMTCDEFIAAGGSKGDLSWDRSHGFISITEASA